MEAATSPRTAARLERCPLCGTDFAAEGQGCRPSCPMAKGCSVVCCPSCGYSFPQERGLAGGLRQQIHGHAARRRVIAVHERDEVGIAVELDQRQLGRAKHFRLRSAMCISDDAVAWPFPDDVGRRRMESAEFELDLPAVPCSSVLGDPFYHLPLELARGLDQHQHAARGWRPGGSTSSRSKRWAPIFAPSSRKFCAKHSRQAWHTSRPKSGNRVGWCTRNRLVGGERDDRDRAGGGNERPVAAQQHQVGLDPPERRVREDALLRDAGVPLPSPVQPAVGSQHPARPRHRQWGPPVHSRLHPLSPLRKGPEGLAQGDRVDLKQYLFGQPGYLHGSSRRF